MQARKTTQAALVGALCVAALTYVLNLDSFMTGLWGDDAHYVILARSIASGMGYQLVNYPTPQPEWAFPPGYPLLMSPLAWLWPTQLLPFKLASTLMMLVTCLLVYWLARTDSQANAALALGVTALFALHPLVVGLSGQVMSETAYLPVSLASMILVCRLTQAGRVPTYHEAVKLLILLVLTISLSVLVRTIGLTLFAAVLLWLLYRRRLLPAGVCAAGVVACLAVLPIADHQFENALLSQGYKAQVLAVVDLTERIQYSTVSLSTYVTEIGPNALVPVFGSRFVRNLGPVAGFGALMVSAVVLLGLIVRHNRWRVYDLYFVLYMLGILQFYNPAVGNAKERFLIPVLPFLLLYFLEGSLALAAIGRSTARRSQSFVLSGTVIALLLLYGIRDASQVAFPARTRMTDITVGADWVKHSTEQDAIIMCDDAISRALYLFRHTVDIPRGRNTDELLYVIDSERVDYIMVAPRMQASRTIHLDEYLLNVLVPFLHGNPERFHLAYDEPSQLVSIYHVLRR